MNKILRTLALLVCLCVATYGIAQHDIRVGYCNTELSSEAEAIQNTNGSGTLTFQFAICLPSSRLQALKGSKIKRIRFATLGSLTGVYCWVRSSLTSYAIGSPTKVGDTMNGWNDVTLTQPVEITGDDIYVGFNGKAPSGTGIYFDGPSNTNAGWFKDGTNNWSNLSGQGYPALCIQAIVEVDDETTISDVAVERCTLGDSYTKVGDKVTATIDIGNYGEATVDAPKLYYSLNGGEAVEVPISGTIAANGTNSYSADIPTDGLDEGTNELRTWIVAEGDGYEGNNSYTTSLLCYKTSFPHKVLVEHFTTLPCSNCPYGLRTLNTILSGKTNYVWVAHHIGYLSDELTQEQSYDLQGLGATSAPLATFDRTVFGNSNGTALPVFGIGYSNAFAGYEALAPNFEKCATTPAFVSVNITNSYNEETRELTTTVEGERNSLFNMFYPAAKLTVELVEDQVNTKGEQIGSGDKVHNNVFRTALTRVVGDDITWTDNSYKETYTYTLPDTWDAEHVRVVAFVNRPLTDTSAAQILNAEQARIPVSSGIGSVLLDNKGKTTNRTYYNLQGQRISQPLSHGTYIVKTASAQGVTTAKHIR